MIDRGPGLIVQCIGAADVIAAVRVARAQRLQVAVKAAATPSLAAPTATAAWHSTCL